MEIITQPWHWAFSGFMIVVVMFLLIYLGQKFGISSSFRAICSAGGAGNKVKYFDFDWKKQDWQLTFVLGAILGGYLASHFLASDTAIAISQSTIQDLSQLGIAAPGINEYVPAEIFDLGTLGSLKGVILLVVGGFLIGFGTRYAGGCTSGHAISGLSNLQLPSLVAVIGFFIGGLLMTHIFLPIILNL